MGNSNLFIPGQGERVASCTSRVISHEVTLAVLPGQEKEEEKKLFATQVEISQVKLSRLS